MILRFGALEVVTLFVDDLVAARVFYAKAFGWTAAFEDDVSVVMRLQNVMINLLKSSEARVLVAPSVVQAGNAGTNALLTIRVDNVDEVCSELQENGVPLLNGPVNRPWGRRTAAISDPDGNVWEVAQVL